MNFLTSTRIIKSFLCALISFCAICFNLYGIKITITDEVAEAIEAVEAAENEEQELEKKAESNQTVGYTNDFPESKALISSPDSVLGLDLLERVGGEISGQVFDKESGEVLSGVVILIEDTDYATISDAQGRFNFSGVDQGVYILTFFKDGYLQAKVTDTVVSDQETAVLNFAMPRKPVELSDEVYELQDFVVTAKEANEFALNLELIMSSESTLSIMSSEDFSKYATSDMGDAVKRVSGVTVEGGKYASIRGLSDRYVSTTLNGLPIASPDPDRLAVQLDLFPTSLFNSVQVFKTYSVERYSNATGAINLITKPIPDESFFKVSLGTKLNSNVEDGRFLLNNRQSSQDKYANGAESRKIPFDEIPQTSPVWTFPFTLPDRYADLYITQEEYQEALVVLESYKELLGRANHNYFGSTNPFGKSFKMDFGNRFDLTNNIQFGFTGGVNYSSSASHNEGIYFKASTDTSAERDFPLTVENFTDPSRAQLYHKAKKIVSELETVLSAGLMFGFQLNDSHQISFNYLNLNTALDRNTRIDASEPGYGNILSAQHGSFRSNSDSENYSGTYPIWVPSDPYLNQTNDKLDYQINEALHYIERDLVSKQIFGKSSLDIRTRFFDTLELNWGIGEDFSAQNEPGFTQTRAVVISQDKDLTLSTRSDSPSDPSPQYIVWREVLEDKTNRTIVLDLFSKSEAASQTSIKLGYNHSVTDRIAEDTYLNMLGVNIDTNDLREKSYIPASEDPGAPMNGLDNTTPTKLTQAAYIALDRESTGQFVSLSQEFLDLNIGGYAGDLELIAGLRNEENSAQVNAIDEDDDGIILNLRGAGTNNPIPVATTGGYEYSQQLPSYAILWKSADENLAIRLSKNETVAFPSAREVSPYGSSAFSGSDIDIGNPSLKPSDVENEDIGFTLKNNEGDALTLNYFRKSVSNRIEKVKGIGNSLKSSDVIRRDEQIPSSDPDPIPDPLNFDHYSSMSYSQNLSAGLYTWYNNPSDADINGFELELTKALSKFGLDNFIISLNYTRIKGEIARMPIEVAAKIKTGMLDVDADNENIAAYSIRRIMQQPEELANFDITYDNSDVGLRTSLIFNYTSDILRGTSLGDSFDYYDDSFESIDFVFSKTFGENLTLKFAAKNITNPLIRTFYKAYDDDFNAVKISKEAYKKGRSFSLSLNYDF